MLLSFLVRLCVGNLKTIIICYFDVTYMGSYGFWLQTVAEPGLL